VTTQSKITAALASAPAAAALIIIGAYRAIGSPILHAVFGPACRFEPSCSAYAQQAVRSHGLIRGGALALARLARCHPLGGHGYDPPPARLASKP